MTDFFATGHDLELVIRTLSVRVVVIASILTILFILIASFKKSHSHYLFAGIVLTVISASVFLIGSTIYLNVVSSSKGPVHWHADTQIWACGQELDLEDPKGRLSNKIGTATLHEHNDKRIHLEGVVVSPEDASLGKSFSVIGGDINSQSLVVPTTEGKKSFLNGQKCADKTAEVQVFAYRALDNGLYTQKKLANPNDYKISPYSNVPPGDCIIVEFDSPRDRTDRMCKSWEVAIQIGRLKGEKL